MCRRFELPKRGAVLALALGVAIAASDAHDPAVPLDAANLPRWELRHGGHVHASPLAWSAEGVELADESGARVRLSLAQLTERAQLELEAWFAALDAAAQDPAVPKPAAAARATGEPPQLAAFRASGAALELRFDERYFYVGSDGFPDHPLMVGIRAWQQQVPLPQPYTGENAWRIPRQPALATQPLALKAGFFRGAVAIAVNGVPIFNPIKNDGRTDTFLAGELDEHGGHCGRADDYHYHLAPLHLAAREEPLRPIAYALDGFPIVPLATDACRGVALDACGGHEVGGAYHYHASKTYPYVQAAFRGVVVEREGQVDPQPSARGVRPALPPLRGARITAFEREQDGRSFVLSYELRGAVQRVRTTLGHDEVRFRFEAPNEAPREERYPLHATAGGGQRRERGGAAGGEPRGERRNEPRGEPRGEARGGRRGGEGGAARGAASDEARTPWILAHAAEMDRDGDRDLVREEVAREIATALEGYDQDGDGAIRTNELEGARGVRTALGGFVREHARELDRDGDGAIARAELEGQILGMFAKADTDGDGRIALDGAAPAPSAPPRAESAPSRSAPGVGRPSFIVILGDDLGAGDVCYGAGSPSWTPELDRLAREGLRFTQAYASAPNCAPTRASLLSGLSTPRHGVFTVIDPRHEPGQPHHRVIAAASRDSLRDEVLTFAERLREVGYATACYGMWNLGRGRSGASSAQGQGFDEVLRPQNLGFESNQYRDAQGRSFVDELNSRAIDFVRRQRERPFVLYLAHHAIHAPFDPDPQLLAEQAGRIASRGAPRDAAARAATMQELDRSVGRLRTALVEGGIAERTWIFFTGDNGGEDGRNGVLRGGKGQLYEGGLRVPLIAWKAQYAGAHESSEPVISADLLPTLLELAKLPAPSSGEIDGRSFAPLLTGAQELAPRELFWHFPCYTGKGAPASAIRRGSWKLVEHFEDGRMELFDLAVDPSEARDLARERPAECSALAQRLRAWQEEVAAPRPTQPNPAYSADARPRRGR